jgi:hypothetical protein
MASSQLQSTVSERFPCNSLWRWQRRCALRVCSVVNAQWCVESNRDYTHPRATTDLPMHVSVPSGLTARVLQQSATCRLNPCPTTESLGGAYQAGQSQAVASSAHMPGATGWGGGPTPAAQLPPSCLPAACQLLPAALGRWPAAAISTLRLKRHPCRPLPPRQRLNCGWLSLGEGPAAGAPAAAPAAAAAQLGQ